MNNHNDYKHAELTDKIIKAFFKVYNILGYGFLEKVYERALLLELTNMGLLVENQRQIKVYYRGMEVGEFFADLIVEERVIIELKAAESLCQNHEFQLII